MSELAAVPLAPDTRDHQLQKPVGLCLTLMALLLVVGLMTNINSLGDNDDLVVESTLGKLAIWMAEQSGNDAEDISSPLARYADNWANELGAEQLDPALLFKSMRNLRNVYFGLIEVLLLIALLGLIFRRQRMQKLYLVILLLLDVLLFNIPTVGNSNALLLLTFAIIAVLCAVVLLPGKTSRVLGFSVALSVLLVGWEASKGFADSINYKVLLPQASWTYETKPTLEDALIALEAGKVDVVVADRKDLDDLMPPHPLNEDDTEALPYANLRYIKRLHRGQGFGFLPVLPAFPGRLSLAVRADEAGQFAALRAIMSRRIATVAGEFADEKLLNLPRNLVLLDLKILNDLNLPHLQMIAEAFLQPARRNGELLLLRILGDAGVYTFSEAIFGFFFGALLGFVLGSIFAHSRLMERGLLSYVVASQTVPILAIAPMVVIWLGASQLSVAVIAAYLTFFPVTINTLRGLQSPATAQVELMRSYAASRWTIMWKLRFPAALPYIFTALKVSATASVVGAIIGELPSGIGDGLGRAILDFSSDYSMVSTPKLWAAIVMAASVGILFFVVVSLAERFVLRGYIRTVD